MQTIAYRSTHGSNSIQYRSVKLWNEIPDEIRNSSSLNLFKKKQQLKAHLIEDTVDEDDVENHIYY